MEFSSNIILSLLMPYRGKPYIRSDVKKVYRWVSLLPDMTDDMEPDMLYVCKLTDAMLRNHLSVDCHFVCVCDIYLSDEDRENSELLRNIIIVNENRSISWLLNLIQNRFLELERWEKEMKDVLLRDGGYQDIMDVSERYLKNALFVLDGAYRLIAYSKTYKSPDPINVSLYEKGYHIPEVMQRFYKYNRFEEYFNNPGVIIGTPGQIAQFETMCKWCWYDGAPLVHVVEVFCNTPILAESQELFELMMHYINICFLREQRRSQNPGQTYGRFLQDLIYGGLTDIGQIGECAKRTGIPMTGFFDAYRIVFRDNGKVLVGRFVQELSSILSGSRIVSKEFEVSLLNIYPRPCVEELSRSGIRQILPLLEKYGGLLGVSAPFTALTDFSHACVQAAVALRYGGRSYCYTPRTDDQADNVYVYSSTLVYHMLHLSSSGSFDFFRSNPYLNKLTELADYDREHDCGLMDILYWYLYYERRATETGKKLHMHRNTVMYHIQHITEMLNIDLDDYMTRLGILLAYHHLESRNCP